MTLAALLHALPPDPTSVGGDDTAMLARCRQGDPAAFRRFVVLHQSMVHAFLARLVGPGPATEDLAQEVFLRAYKAFSGYDAGRGARVSTWLLTIARHAALDALKRRRVPEARADVDLVEQAVSPGADPEVARSQRELGLAISRAAAALSHEQREVFLLADFHGLSMEEIAGVVGAPVNTVKARLFRAREQLRERLEGWQVP